MFSFIIYNVFIHQLRPQPNDKYYFIKQSIVLSLVKHPVDKAIQKQVHEPQNSACSEIRGQRYGEKSRGIMPLYAP